MGRHLDRYEKTDYTELVKKVEDLTATVDDIVAKLAGLNKPETKSNKQNKQNKPADKTVDKPEE